MKIEKLDIEDIIGRDGLLFIFEKINEIIDFLSLVSENIQALKIQNRNQENRLSDLEQCPVNDIRQCRPLTSYDDDMRDFGLTMIKMIKENWCVENKKEIPKPNYHPDDVKLNDNIKPIRKMLMDAEITEKGTFEWAFIQMKNGKNITRKSSDLYINMDKFYLLHIEEAFNHDDFIAQDWEIFVK